MKNTITLSLLLLISIFTNGCGKSGDGNASSNGGGVKTLTPLNLIVVLDLSNRLVTTPDQVKKDQKILDGILSIFVTI